MAGAKNAVELAAAYISLTTDSSRLAKDVKQGMEKGSREGGRSTEKESAKTGKKSGKSFGQRFGESAKAGMVAAGAAAGLAMAAGYQGAVEKEMAIGKLSGSMGMSEAQTAQAGRVAGEVFAAGYSDSMAEVGNAMEAVQASFGSKLSDKQLDDLTGKAMTLAQVMDVDVSEAMAAAGELVKKGLAKDGGQAMDMLTKSMQSAPKLARDEIVAATNEYSKHFKSAGISGSKMMAMLAHGAQSGVIGVDKVGDSMKEVANLAVGGGKAVDEAYASIGMKTSTMAQAMATGGVTADKAMTQLANKLLAIKDPATRAQTAIALFGAPLEDLGMTEIPAFLQALATAPPALDATAGATAGLEDAMANTRSINELKNSATTLFTDIMTKAAPILTVAADALRVLSPILTPLALGLTAIAVGQTAVNLAMKANPVMAIVAVLAVLAGYLIDLGIRTGFFEDAWRNMSEGIAKAAGWLQEKLRPLLDFLGDLFSKIDGLGGKGGGLFSGFGSRGGSVPGLASGGTVTGSGTVLVGEVGPELLHLPRGASVQPLDHLAEHGSLSGGGNTPAIHITAVNPQAEPASKTVTAAANMLAAIMA